LTIHPDLNCPAFVCWQSFARPAAANPGAIHLPSVADSGAKDLPRHWSRQGGTVPVELSKICGMVATG
ncbi:MAG: hypothetical protein WA303_03035, partial [Bradyrhizobium sp.]